MKELPKVNLDIPYGAEERVARLAAQEGVQAIERELFPNEVVTNAVEISLWVRGREIRTVVDNETLHRVMAILLGES